MMSTRSCFKYFIEVIKEAIEVNEALKEIIMKDIYVSESRDVFLDVRNKLNCVHDNLWDVVRTINKHEGENEDSH